MLIPPITLVSSGVRRIDRQLAAAGRNIKDLRKPFKEIADDFRKMEQRVFATAGYGTWAPLSPKYAAQKARLWGSQPLLVADGTLFRSLTQPRAIGSVRKVDRRRLMIGSNDPLVAIHTEGSENLPARPPIMVLKRDTDRWSEIIMTHINRGLR